MFILNYHKDQKMLLQKLIELKLIWKVLSSFKKNLLQHLKFVMQAYEESLQILRFT